MSNNVHDLSTDSHESLTTFSLLKKITAPQSASPTDPAPKRYMNYKTELCKNFEAGKHCKWGGNCCFAHGKHELRSRTQKEELKCKSCRGFNETGVCSYGVRCQFLHFKPYRKFQEMLEIFEFSVVARAEAEPIELISLALEGVEAKIDRLQVFRKMGAFAGAEPRRFALNE